MKTRNASIVVSAALCAAVAILPMAVSAATYYVSPDGDDDNNDGASWAAPFATIQKALGSANSWGGSIWISNGTYKIESELVPSCQGLTIRSFSGNPADVTIDADGNCRCFNCTGTGGTTAFKGITFINGSASGDGGGVLATSGCAFEDCVFRNCTATGHGGGLASNSTLNHASNLLVDGCSATSSTSDGGGIYVPGNLGSEGISNCRIYNCRAGRNGGGLHLSVSTFGSTVSNCDISCNTASGATGGGGIMAKNVAIRNCTVTNNVCDYATLDAPTGGSGIRLVTKGTIDGCLIKNNSFTYNCARYNGGGSAVWLEPGSSLVNSAIIGNSGARSVGMQWYLCGGILVSNCLFKSNVARMTGGNGRGGILYLYGITEDCLITDCRFIDNHAASDGSFVTMSLGGGSGEKTLRIRNCLISGNVQTGGQGLVWATSGTSETARRISLENCTVVSNTIYSTPGICPVFQSGYTSRNFVYVSGCAILFNGGKAAFDDTFKASANVTYNCTELSGMVAGNITYDSSKPLFADLENGDFRPTADSQLRDIVPAAEWMGNGKLGSKSDLGSGYELQPAGTYGVNVVWTDAVPRLYKNYADIGCFEFWRLPTPPGLAIIIK